MLKILHDLSFCSTFAADFTLMPTIQPYIVDLDRLDKGKYQFDFVLDTASLQHLERTELHDINVSVYAGLDLNDDGFILSMKIIGKAVVVCDRCLDDMEVDVIVDEKDVETEVVHDSIDLAWIAYELVIVSLPLVHCHPKGGCNPEMAALLQSHLCSTVEEPEDN